MFALRKKFCKLYNEQVKISQINHLGKSVNKRFHKTSSLAKKNNFHRTDLLIHVHTITRKPQKNCQTFDACTCLCFQTGINFISPFLIYHCLINLIIKFFTEKK